MSEPDSTIQGGISFGRAARARDRAVEGLEVADAAGVPADALWAAMRRASAAVSVVTARGDEGLLGITVSAFSLLSLDPPLVLACIHAVSYTHLTLPTKRIV